MPLQGPTNDHLEIRRWAESQGAVPAEILPHMFNGEPSVLRILFGKVATAELRPIDWETFFAHFDLLNLTFLYEPGGRDYSILHMESKAASQFETRPN